MTEQPAPTSPEDAQVEVVDNPDRHRFDIRVGGKRAGFSMYRDVDDITNAPQRVFFHTVIGDEFGEQGHASTLTRDALAQTTAAGRRIVPVCPYVEKWVSRHDDVEGHVDAVLPAHLDAVR